MSLDERLREGLGEISADLSSEPLDVGSDLQGVLVAGRRRRVLRRAYTGVAVAAVLLIALFAGSGIVRNLGIEKLKTADDPPAEQNRDEGQGGSAGSSDNGVVVPRGAGADGEAGGAKSQAGSQAGTSRGGPTPAGGKAATPTPPGTYSFDVFGSHCGTFQGFTSCEYFKELELTFDPPTGSHQRETARFRYDGESKMDSEHSDDYRPDGVYWEHFSATFVNPWGVPFAWACPELEAEPRRWWRTGAKPGDHSESTRSCNDYSPGESESGYRSTGDILRAETISVGGREVDTFFVRQEVFSGANLRSFWEGSVLPDHPRLFVTGHWWWKDDGGDGELWATLKSLTPS
jgi:hypothetical protein